MMGLQTTHYAWLPGVERFAAIGTICAYPKYTHVPFREDSLWDRYIKKANAGDGLAKMLLVLAQAYRQQYGIDAIEKHDDAIIVCDDGSPTRELLCAEDCTRAIVLAADRCDKPDPVNMRADFRISVKKLVHLIADLTVLKDLIIWDASRPGRQPRCCLDVSRAERQLGLRAQTSLEEV